MTFQEIIIILEEKFREVISVENTETLQPRILVEDKNRLLEIAIFLKTEKELFFDQLACISAIDNETSLELVYQFFSYPFEHSLSLAVILKREKPVIESLTSLWKAADWHEREAFDMMGIHFENHPDLRRILMPSDWQGFPLRKDYQTQENYHGIKVDF